MTKSQQFASDNYSGICPEAMEYLRKANQNHVLSYGEDKWTAEACDRFRELFESHCEVFFVFNGTAGNALSLATMCQSYHSIICHRNAHVETDECGAPEFFSHGAKLLVGEGCDGKLVPKCIDETVLKRTDIHYPKPRAISVTQATELGTVYTIEELKSVHTAAKKHKLKLHMDGARFANAVAALNVSPGRLTTECGVDILVFGGSKNGLAVGEAVIFFNTEMAEEFAYRCKQAGQLASKMRFLSAQWAGILKTDAWLKHARHANDCAAELERQIREIPELETLFPREVNSVFVEMPKAVIDALHRKGWHFYTFIGLGGARLMCSWDTTQETIDAFVADLKNTLIKS